MKVTLAKHGGWAAGVQLASGARVVDADTLPRSAAAELAHLVSAAQAIPSAAAKAPSRSADVSNYAITVEDGQQTTVLRQSDLTESPAFAALREWIESQPVQK